ncbi:transposase [Chloroflexota bacterium]
MKHLTRLEFTAEEKIRIVLEGFRRDTPIRDLGRREGIKPSTYYAWLKDFMEAGNRRLT